MAGAIISPAFLLMALEYSHLGTVLSRMKIGFQIDQFLPFAHVVMHLSNPSHYAAASLLSFHSLNVNEFLTQWRIRKTSKKKTLLYFIVALKAVRSVRFTKPRSFVFQPVMRLQDIVELSHSVRNGLPLRRKPTSFFFVCEITI